MAHRFTAKLAGVPIAFSVIHDEAAELLGAYLTDEAPVFAVESDEALIDAEIEGATMSIALNFHYVFDCVNAVGNSDTLLLELQGSMQPAIFKAYGKINYLYLLMPVRM